jgi:hypothetical protein
VGKGEGDLTAQARRVEVLVANRGGGGPAGRGVDAEAMCYGRAA